jgi:hypothetical protein
VILLALGAWSFLTRRVISEADIGVHPAGKCGEVFSVISRSGIASL